MTPAEFHPVTASCAAANIFIFSSKLKLCFSFYIYFSTLCVCNAHTIVFISLLERERDVFGFFQFNSVYIIMNLISIFFHHIQFLVFFFCFSSFALSSLSIFFPFLSFPYTFFFLSRFQY